MRARRHNPSRRVCLVDCTLVLVLVLAVALGMHQLNARLNHVGADQFTPLQQLWTVDHQHLHGGLWDEAPMRECREQLHGLSRVVGAGVALSQTFFRGLHVLVGLVRRLAKVCLKFCFSVLGFRVKDAFEVQSNVGSHHRNQKGQLQSMMTLCVVGLPAETQKCRSGHVRCGGHSRCSAATTAAALPARQQHLLSLSLVFEEKKGTQTRAGTAGSVHRWMPVIWG